MKTRCKKIFSVVLVLCLIFVMAGCGKTDKEKLVGSWKYEMDMTAMMNEMMAEEEEEFAEYFEISSFMLTLNLTFTEDGKYVSALDEASMQAAMETLKADMIAGVTKLMEEMLEGTGITLEQALEASGMTLEDMVEDMGFDDLTDELTFTSEGVYDAKEGKLFLTEGDTVDESEYAVYELEEDVLTITEVVGTDMEEMEEMFPLVFVKQK